METAVGFQTIAEDLKNYPNNNEEELTLQLHTDSSDRVPHSITISQLDSGVTQQHLESMAGNFPNFHVGFFPLLCICLLLTPAFLLKVNRDDPGLWLSESIFL